MKWFILASLVYLSMIVWAQIDNSRRDLREAIFNTFVAPWIYFVLGIPYHLYLGARRAFIYTWKHL